MAQNLTPPDVTSPVTRQVQEVDALDNLTRLDNFIKTLVTQFNALNQEVQSGGTQPLVGDQRAFVAVSYDPVTQIQTFTMAGGGTATVSLSATPATASLSQLRLTSIASHLRRSETNLTGSHGFSYHVSGRSQIATLQMEVNGIAVETIPLPSQDGAITGTFTIDAGEWSSIVAANANSLTFQLVGTDSNSDPISSNTVLVTLVGDSQVFFYALSDSNNPGTIDLSGEEVLHHAITGPGDAFDIDLGPTLEDQWVILLNPQDIPLTEIRLRDFNNAPALAAFTVTNAVRSIDGQSFQAAVLGPTEAGNTLRYRIEL